MLPQAEKAFHILSKNKAIFSGFLLAMCSVPMEMYKTSANSQRAFELIYDGAHRLEGEPQRTRDHIEENKRYRDSNGDHNINAGPVHHKNHQKIHSSLSSSTDQAFVACESCVREGRSNQRERFILL